MTTKFIAALAFALGFGASAAYAENLMTKGTYKAEKERIQAEYRADSDRCKGFSGNARDICNAEAKGRQKVAMAELDALNQNTPAARESARIARAEADYDVALEKCDDLAGNRKDVCQQEVKSVRDKTKANAKADRKASNAQHAANDKIAEASREAAETGRDADYRVAVERCDTFAGERKDACVREAKARFGK